MLFIFLLNMKLVGAILKMIVTINGMWFNLLVFAICFVIYEAVHIIMTIEEKKKQLILKKMQNLA